MTNVVLLTVDSLPADHCSSYGYHRETTPHLDTLAADGVQFANAYSPSSHTRESVPSLLTGRYPHAAVDDGYHLAVLTLATYLNETHHVGAFHSNPFVSRAYGFDRDFDDDLYLGRHKVLALAQRLWDKIRGHHYARAETINERALGRLDSLSEGEPFFVWNHYMDVHGPYESPELYRSEFVDVAVSDEEARRLYQRALDDPDTIDEDNRRTLVDLYDGEIRYTDAQMRSFLDSLENRGLLDDALVVISRRRVGVGDNDQYDHPRVLSEELVRVPLVTTGLGSEGHVSEVPVSGLDVAPTVHSTAKAPLPIELAGIPFQQVLTDEPAHQDRCVVLEARGGKGASDRRRYRAVNNTDTLDVERSLSNTDPLDADGKLTRYLADHLTARHRETGTKSGDADGATDERLEALGYK